eukprot:TRINITY_DN2461_c0_g1_i4.p1 TRINITY_DN2461_c0_g1~~TRINITY_DN2461_c0_g1_i4.p1  ORF type:complete len:199 (+),score=55.40 TRINITY_DN2461_c0_g1_i4:288-884(+)
MTHVKAHRRRGAEPRTYVWILVETDNYGALNFVDGFLLVPNEWKVIQFRNSGATSWPKEIKGSQVVSSVLGGSHAKNNKLNQSKKGLSYPAFDLTFVVGDIIGHCVHHGIEDMTTVYFVYGPHDPEAPRYQQSQEYLTRFGIGSTCLDANSNLSEVFKREGVDAAPYAAAHAPVSRPRAASKGPQPRKRSTSVGRGVY